MFHSFPHLRECLHSIDPFGFNIRKTPWLEGLPQIWYFHWFWYKIDHLKQLYITKVMISTFPLSYFHFPAVTNHLPNRRTFTCPYWYLMIACVRLRWQGYSLNTNPAETMLSRKITTMDTGHTELTDTTNSRLPGPIVLSSFAMSDLHQGICKYCGLQLHQQYKFYYIRCAIRQ